MVYQQSILIWYDNFLNQTFEKLESTKRPEIVYTKTGGGVTAKLDAVTFELFNHACEVYYKNTSEKLGCYCYLKSSISFSF
jgi:hypothetical protein